MTTETDWNLLAKHVQGETSPEEAQRLEAWLREDPAHQQLLDKARQAWKASGDVYQAYTPNTKRAWSIIDQKTGGAVPRRGETRSAETRSAETRSGETSSEKVVPLRSRRASSSRQSWLLRVAAVGLLAVGLVYLVQFLTPPGGWGLAEVRTAAHQTQQVTLADGTRVWLNENTTLRYPEDFDGESREVFLKGEAFFDVARNEAQPFLIEGGGAVTKVLGTSFNVSAVPQDTVVVVTVVSGTVALSDEDDLVPLILQKGEQGVYNIGAQQTSKARQVAQNSLAWRTRRMQFDNQPLATVGEVLGDAYQKTVVVDPATAPLKLTAQFDDQPLEEVLEVIALTLDVAYRTEGDTIYFQEIKK